MTGYCRAEPAVRCITCDDQYGFLIIHSTAQLHRHPGGRDEISARAA
jgi:hypothetical protein